MYHDTQTLSRHALRLRIERLESQNRQLQARIANMRSTYRRAAVTIRAALIQAGKLSGDKPDERDSPAPLQR